MTDYSKLNTSQYEAVTDKNDRLLFLAGAGVGKTTTLVHRVAYLLEQGVPEGKILLLTFTNKAANEMADRIKNMVHGSIKACTFHSFCNEELKKYARSVGVSNAFTIITPSDAAEVVKMSITDCGFQKLPGMPKAAEIASMESLMFNKRITLEEVFTKETKYGKYYLFADEIKQVIKSARRYRFTNNMLTYDDLMELFIIILKKFPSIAERVRDEYQYIMVDEYQDTNIPQEEILDLIDPVNLAVVGDDSQALYGFRGATVQNILSFPDKHNCKTVMLDQNYRSNQHILDLSNKMMEECCTEGFPKELHANHDDGAYPLLCRVDDEKSEALYVFERMKDWTRSGNKASDLCVLIRSTNASKELERMLVKNQVPFEKRGGPKFFEKKHVQDVLALLNINCDARNEISWFRALNILKNIGDVYARKLAGRCKTEGPQVLMEKTIQKRSYGKDVKDLYDLLFTDKYENWTDLFYAICDYYIKITRANIMNSKMAQDAKDESLEKIRSEITPDLELMKEVTHDYSTARQFLENLLLENIKDPAPEEDQFVVSTIHSAKGLEFECVILMGATEGLFPYEPTNEELRCYYVALTRPKKFLIITSPERYFRNGRTFYGEIPYFLRSAMEYLDVLDERRNVC